MDPLRVNTERRGDVVQVSVAGELDLATAPRLEEALRAAEESDAKTVLLDLRELDFMDSTGLRAIISADQRARESGHHFAVVQGDENVKRVFEVTRLHERVQIVDAPEDLAS